MTRTRFKPAQKSKKKHKPRRKPATAEAAETNGQGYVDVEVSGSWQTTPAQTPATGDDTEILHRIQAKEIEAQIAHQAWKSIKGEAKEAKERYEGLVDEMRTLILESKEGELPLFQAGTTSANGTAHAAPADDESWREEKIAGQGLTPKIIASLEAVNLRTWGDLVDYQDPARNGGYERRLTDVAGIGRAAVDKIDDARDAFLSKWRREQDTRRAEVQQAIADVAEGIEQAREDAVVAAGPAEPASIMDIADAAFPVDAPIEQPAAKPKRKRKKARAGA